MTFFRFRGGIHPPGRKELTAECAIEDLPMPELLRIPLQQHIGTAAEPLVATGNKVLKGQLLAAPQGKISAAIHAPTSGEIMAIGRYPAPHPSGLPERTITLKPDGKDEWAELPAPLDAFGCAPEIVAERVASSGVVGMGGATFPSAVKLTLGARYNIHTLVINGAECEPYLTCDDRLMREHTAQVIAGIRIMRHTLGAKKAIVAIESNKPKSYAAMRKEAAAYDDVEVTRVPTRYPMGSEKHLVHMVTGAETPARALTADIGIVVHNTATAFAVYEAVVLGRPLISRVVTVSGGAVSKPGNYRVLVGTPISALLKACGKFKTDPSRLLSGGPMMGQPLVNLKAPIVKGTNGVLALTERESAEREVSPCIRCATCVSACPCGLLPLEMAARIRKEDLDGAAATGLTDCISCGSCSWVCPSNIPLVQYFNYAKGRLIAIQRERHKQEETKRLIEQRTERMERLAAEKLEALARRKAEMAAKKKEKEKVSA